MSLKGIAIVSVVVIGVLCTLSVLSLPKGNPDLSEFLLSEELDFQEYLEKFGKKYEGAEYEYRLEVFKTNTGFIRAFNKLGYDWVLGLTSLTDLTASEFSSKYTSPIFAKPSETLAVKGANLKYPSAVDWRSQGAVTPVANQGACSSSYAFSSVGAVEGAWKIAGNSLVALSVQQVVDCSTRYGNNGCTSGTMDYSFNYVAQNGLTSSSAYPYTASKGNCKNNLVTVATIRSFNDVPSQSPNQLYAAVANQPVSVAVDADPTIWQNYKGGVISRNCGNNLDLGVLIVGYNSLSNPPYWIVKNAFGQNWGESGYIRIAVVNGDGVCGIQIAPSYPNIN